MTSHWLAGKSPFPLPSADRRQGTQEGAEVWATSGLLFDGEGHIYVSAVIFDS